MPHIHYNMPVITYPSIKVGGKTVTLDSTVKASYVSKPILPGSIPPNRVDISYKVGATYPISILRVYAVAVGDELDLEASTIVQVLTNLPTNSTGSFSFNITEDVFLDYMSPYTVYLAAQNASDGCWDIVSIVFDSSRIRMLTSDGNELFALINT